MPREWSSTDRYRSNRQPQTRGLTLIRRYAHGEKLTESQMEAMRAAMYLIEQYVRPPRGWEHFRWQGPDHFIENIWPEIKDRSDVMNGNFGDGSKAP